MVQAGTYVSSIHARLDANTSVCLAKCRMDYTVAWVFLMHAVKADQSVSREAFTPSLAILTLTFLDKSLTNRDGKTDRQTNKQKILNVKARCTSWRGNYSGSFHTCQLTVGV